MNSEDSNINGIADLASHIKAEIPEQALPWPLKFSVCWKGGPIN